MLASYVHRDGRLEPGADGSLAQTAWVDLCEPTASEVDAVRSALGVTIPSLADMQEIELSSRLYEDDGARFMTLTVLSGLDAQAPARSPVTFIVKGGTLVTVRHVELKVFSLYAQRAGRAKTGACADGGMVMLGLLDSVIDRLADALEQTASEVDMLSRDVFHHPAAKARRITRDLEAVIERIGRQGDLLSMIQESLISMSRVVTYFAATDTEEKKVGRDGRQRIRQIQRDATSLSEHTLFLLEKVSFLLDATLGLISLQQNTIIKIFSIVSVLFMPPTLVASVYGMNFRNMPELQWAFGYPYALGMMVLFAVLPLLFFWRKGWL